MRAAREQFHRSAGIPRCVVICSAVLKIRRLCTLLLFLSAMLQRSGADEWISEEHHCAVTIPSQESWIPKLRQDLPFGEIIYHSASMTSSEGIMITVVKDMPTSDIRNPAVVKRINELLESQGWSPDEPKRMEQFKRPFLQFTSFRRDALAGNLVGVTRATPRGPDTLYVVTAYGKGDASRAEEPAFMRVIETFRIVEVQTARTENREGPAPGLYRLAIICTLGAAALLICSYSTVRFFARHGHHHI